MHAFHRAPRPALGGRQRQHPDGRHGTALRRPQRRLRGGGHAPAQRRTARAQQAGRLPRHRGRRRRAGPCRAALHRGREGPRRGAGCAPRGGGARRRRPAARVLGPPGQAHGALPEGGGRLPGRGRLAPRAHDGGSGPRGLLRRTRLPPERGLRASARQVGRARADCQRPRPCGRRGAPRGGTPARAHQGTVEARDAAGAPEGGAE
mmetsp:Transcript_14105/g.47780  ORF Transcript_14105/g.47780 Transcript_14105/m.47780 type:complete len:206 (-) Transcript_14105:258-875(-)